MNQIIVTKGLNLISNIASWKYELKNCYRLNKLPISLFQMRIVMSIDIYGYQVSMIFVKISDLENYDT